MDEEKVLLETLYNLSERKEKYICDLFYGRFWLLVHDRSYYLEHNDAKKHISMCLRTAISQKLKPGHSILTYIGPQCFEVINQAGEIFVMKGPFFFSIATAVKHFFSQFFKK